MAIEVMRDRQTATEVDRLTGKVDRLKKEVQEYENELRELRACKKAIEFIAGHICLEVDLTPVPSDKEIHHAAELLAHPHLTMPTVSEVMVSANRVA